MTAHLELSPHQMREYGYRVIDVLVEHYSSLRGQSVVGKSDPAALQAKLQETPPERGVPFEKVLDRLSADVFANVARVNHPRFFGVRAERQQFCGRVGASALDSGFNVFEGTWFAGSGPAAVELAVLDWMRQWFGFPEGMDGIFVSGGSIANLTALAVARRALLSDDLTSATAYCSDQTHSSVERAFAVLGLPANRLRRIPADECFRLPLDGLQRAVAADRSAGLRPFCAIANAGTTNTGAVDPLRKLAGFLRRREDMAARRRRVWSGSRVVRAEPGCSRWSRAGRLAHARSS